MTATRSPEELIPSPAPAAGARTGAGASAGARPAPAQALLGLINGFQVSQAIHTAAVLGIADHLGDATRSADDLAAAAGAHPGALYRLLRALAAAGVLREEDGRRFSLTEVGACLRSDSPAPLAGWAAYVGQDSYWRAWGALAHSVRTGENAFRHVHGEDVWSFRARHPAAGAAFDAAMTSLSRTTAGAVVDAYDFSAFGSVADVAGGHGALLDAVLARHPGVRGILFDQPHVVAGAREVLERAGVADRCQVVGGSFFDAVPEGADAYVLKAIIHDWEDGPAEALLRTCRSAMGPGARLLLVERVVGPPNEGAPAKFSDLNMLVGPEGRERTRAEYEALLAAAGFRLAHVVPTAAGLSVLEAHAR